jgi:hypothetical protein
LCIFLSFIFQLKEVVSLKNTTIIFSILVFLISFLYSCATPKVWNHPTASQRQFYSDQMYCNQYANRMASNAGHSKRQLARSFPAGGIGGVARAAAQGAAAGEIERIKKEAFNSCMYSKGYYLGPQN